MPRFSDAAPRGLERLIVTYLKSLVVGISALIFYLILVPAIALLLPLLLQITGQTDGFLIGAAFHLRSPLFLAFAGLVFIAGIYWKFHRLRVMQS
jgi:hypothetical protein